MRGATQTAATHRHGNVAECPFPYSVLFWRCEPLQKGIPPSNKIFSFFLLFQALTMRRKRPLATSGRRALLQPPLSGGLLSGASQVDPTSMSSTEIQRRLVGGMNLSLALPRARAPKNTLVQPAQTAMSASGWSCAVCGAINPWRRTEDAATESTAEGAGEGRSCRVCAQRAVASSLRDQEVWQLEELRRDHEGSGSGGGGNGPSGGGGGGGGVSGAQRARLGPAAWAELEASAEDRQLGDEAEPCPICLEDFGPGLPQVTPTVPVAALHLSEALCLALPPPTLPCDLSLIFKKVLYIACPGHFEL